MEYFEKTITEKTEEAVRNKTANFVDRKEMSEFLVEIKVAINNLNNSIINLENKFNNSIASLENKFSNSIASLENKFSNSIINLEKEHNNSIASLENKFNNSMSTLESRLDLKIEKASNKNLWLVITVGIIQITTVLMAIYLSRK